MNTHSTRRMLAAVLMCGCLIATARAEQKSRPTPAAPKAERELATEFCREQALTFLKYPKTVEWSDLAKSL